MKISLIVAKAKNNVIGKDNGLVWKLSADLRHFKSTTTGHHLIMGRKTFESTDKPLPNRTSVVITRNENYTVPEGHIVVTDLQEALKACRLKKLEKIFISGGGEIYKIALPYVDEMIITEVDAKPEGDTFFPDVNWNEWQETSRDHHSSDEKNEYSFDIVNYRRK
ncbi:MAG TPA: dihydrofolate reductase [Anditalea sp.]|nr:dihydrofolate reductase [Anditalea sp.]